MKFIIVKLLKAYQFIISPLMHPSCRYNPTCSQYMIDAVGEKGHSMGCLPGNMACTKVQSFWAVLGMILLSSIFSKKQCK